MNYRPLRVGKLIREELNKLIQREVEISGALATITDVAIDKKLERARVYVSVLPMEKSAGALDLFKKSEGRLQYLLGRKLNIKPMPHIEFVPDRGPEHAAEVEKILIKDQNNESGHVAK
ncbi:MAG: ribosome-binding factor A [Candidatus Liptonbacteria bacterium]|nr:ribosome-binding factor A [Candidatus Liptonbacteria bacterium]